MSNLKLGNPIGDKGRKIGASLGGQAVKDRKPPDTCPKCGQDVSKRTWHSYIGHLGLHSTADKYYSGDAVAALRDALSKQDPFPENGAWSQFRKGG